MTTADVTPTASVFTVVLTYDAPWGELSDCVAAAQGQSLLPAEVLVVDNHGREPLDAHALRSLGPVPVRVLRLDENTGVAGGYTVGMEQFLRSDCTHLWAMDDDVRPDPTCLAELLRALAERVDRAVGMPRAIDLVTGAADDNGYGWWGVLVPRAAIEACGFPKVEFFYGIEEQEYFIDRLPLAGFPIARAPSAVIRSRQRATTSIAPWKYYYLARNVTYQYLYDRRHIALGTRLKSLAHSLLHWPRTALVEPHDRARKLGYLARGVLDGVLRRLGKRVQPDRADRSWDVSTR